MNVVRAWEREASRRTYNLQVNLLLAGKSLALSIPPLLLLVLTLSGFVSYQVANTRAFSLSERQASQIEDLQLKSERLERLLAHKEKQKAQMVSLAEARSTELWEELDSRDREISRLWRVVGERPALADRGSKPRRTLLGSRAGETRNALAVKVGYSQLSSEFEQNGREMESLAKAAQDYRQKKIDAYQADLASRTPSIWPCQGELSSEFGNRLHPVYGYGRFHAGCDITAPHGTPIQATAAGTVCHSDWLGGYGKTIEIDHGNGLKTLYAHCSELLVAEGTKVTKGQTIAKVGTTGLSSGPHCHYEVRQGDKQIDPMPYLKQKDAPKPIANL